MNNWEKIPTMENNPENPPNIIDTYLLFFSKKMGITRKNKKEGLKKNTNDWPDSKIKRTTF